MSYPLRPLPGANILPPDGELPEWVDRAVLNQILNRIPPEGRQPFLDLLSTQLREFKPPEAALSITAPSDPELSDLLRRLLER